MWVLMNLCMGCFLHWAVFPAPQLFVYLHQPSWIWSYRQLWVTLRVLVPLQEQPVLQTAAPSPALSSNVYVAQDALELVTVLQLQPSKCYCATMSSLNGRGFKDLIGTCQSFRTGSWLQQVHSQSRCLQEIRSFLVTLACIHPIVECQTMSITRGTCLPSLLPPPQTKWTCPWRDF